MASLLLLELLVLVLLGVELVAPVSVAAPVEPVELPDGVLELELELLAFSRKAA